MVHKVSVGLCLLIVLRLKDFQMLAFWRRLVTPPPPLGRWVGALPGDLCGCVVKADHRRDNREMKS